MVLQKCIRTPLTRARVEVAFEQDANDSQKSSSQQFSIWTMARKSRQVDYCRVPI